MLPLLLTFFFISFAHSLLDLFCDFVLVHRLYRAGTNLLLCPLLKPCLRQTTRDLDLTLCVGWILPYVGKDGFTYCSRLLPAAQYARRKYYLPTVRVLGLVNSEGGGGGDSCLLK
jgi:hypothetical protein